MRGALGAAQERLDNLVASHADDSDYQARWQAIRHYIAAQLADEAKLIAPTFQGRGPRR